MHKGLALLAEAFPSLTSRVGTENHGACLVGRRVSEAVIYGNSGGKKEKSHRNNFCPRVVFEQTGAREAPATSHRGLAGGEAPARGVNEVRTGPRRNPLVGPVSTEKGVPGDGDALLINFGIVLLRDRSARDPVPRCARRICLHIVRLRVNYQRRPAIAEHRVIVAA